MKYEKVTSYSFELTYIKATTPLAIILYRKAMLCSSKVLLPVVYLLLLVAQINNTQCEISLRNPEMPTLKKNSREI
jgi:hypothetical protein